MILSPIDEKCVNKWIRETRKFEKVKQNTLANELGISPSTLAGYEMCRCTPSIQVFIKIVDLLGYDIAIIKRD